MGRINEYDRQNGRRRKRNPIIYIICEGTETEPRYFKAFRTRFCKIDIIPLSSAYKSADSLVKKVKSTLGENPYYPDEGDVVWCVFDCDDNTNDMLLKAQQLSKKFGYRIAFSNPCFEYWYLLHFCEYKAYLENCNAVLNQLRKKGRIENYQKSGDVYQLLLGLQDIAIKNSKERLKSLAYDKIELMTRESNPATNVSELVGYLNSKRNE